VKSYLEALEGLLEHSEKLRKKFEKVVEQSKGDEKIHSKLIEIYEPIKESEEIIIKAMDNLHLNSLQFLKETMEWNTKHGITNDHILEKFGQKRVDEALSLKD
tara:strand:+ start:94 stop:402 length:309 start_codon:yes stop_codon:yes gene_type:complete